MLKKFLIVLVAIITFITIFMIVIDLVSIIFILDNWSSMNIESKINWIGIAAGILGSIATLISSNVACFVAFYRPKPLIVSALSYCNDGSYELRISNESNFVVDYVIFKQQNILSVRNMAGTEARGIIRLLPVDAYEEEKTMISLKINFNDTNQAKLILNDLVSQRKETFKFSKTNDKWEMKMERVSEVF